MYHFNFFTQMILVFFSSIVFIGCSVDNGSSNNLTEHTISISGKIVDGYISNAKVCIDENENNLCDNNEISTSTDAQGKFELQTSSAGYKQFISIGGTDIATTLDFNGTLKNIIELTADKNITSLYITPLTTIASNLYIEEKLKNSSYTLTEAKDKTAENLGIAYDDVIADPMLNINKISFNITQQIIHTLDLIQVELDENQNSFTNIMDKFANSINNDSTSKSFNVSNAIAILTESLADEKKEFIQKYITEITQYINNSNADLDAIQKKLQPYKSEAQTYLENNDINLSQQILENINKNIITITSDQNVTVLENQTSALSITASDTNSQTLIYSLAKTDLSSFTIDSSTGEVIFIEAPEYEIKNIYNITAIVSDGTNEVSKDITIKILNIDDTIPVITSDNNITIMENTTSAFSIEATDEENNLIYSIAKEDASYFNINSSNGSVTFKIAADYETKFLYKLIATVDDGANQVEQNVTIHIQNIEEVPVLSDFNSSININSATDTIVGNINIINIGDTNISAFTLSDTPYFDINSSGYIKTIKELNYDINSSFSLTAFATNSIGDSQIVNVAISINDAKPILTNFLGSISERATQETEVLGNTIIKYSGDTPISNISLGGVGSENFEISTTGIISLKNGATLNYNTSTLYTLTAIATNSAGDSNTANVSISVLKYFSPFEIAKLQVSDSNVNHRFGTSVSMSGDYIVVGSYGVDSNDTNEGAIYIFKRGSDTNITQLGNKITASDVNASYNFGYSVDIDGDYIVVGAKNKDTAKSGNIYLFKRGSDSNISKIANIQADDATANDYFGASVSISGNFIAVGATGKDDDKGAAYIFKRVNDSSITQIAKIQESDATANDNFGYSVSIDGNYTVIGAMYEDTNASNAGKAYLYKISTSASLISQFQSNDIEADDNFGNSVSIDGDYIAVGALGESSKTSNGGSVYIFKRTADTQTGVTQIAKLNADDTAVNDKFGYSVNMNGDFITIGSIGQDTTASDAGSVYIFKKTYNDSITQRAKIQAHDAKANDNFGYAISMDGNYIVSGAFRESSSSNNVYTAGAYIFNIEPENRIYIYSQPQLTLDINESIRNSSFIFDAASPNGAISYTLSGADEGQMIFNNNILSFINIPDYEFPSDIGADHTYNIDILISDNTDTDNNINLDMNISIHNQYLLDIAKLELSDAQINDYFGSRVSMSGDYIAVSAIGEDTEGSGAGSVHIYKKVNNEISFIQKLQSNDIEAGDAFGYSLAMDGDYLVVGAIYDDTNAVNTGSAYIFKKNSSGIYTQTSKLTKSNAIANDYFATSLSISGDNIVIGAKGRDNNKGAVYIYKTNGTFIKELSTIGIEAGDNFGYSVSIDGNYIVASAIYEDTNATNAGSVYVYKRTDDSTINRINTFQSNNIGANDNFGNSLSIHGNYIVVGASQKNSKEGRAYIFKRNSDLINGVSQIAELEADSIVANDEFGNSVTTNGTFTAVAALNKDSGEGTVYIFDNTNGASLTKIKAINSGIHDNKPNDNFGASLAIDGDYVVVGATGKDTLDITNSGAAYLFKKD